MQNFQQSVKWNQCKVLALKNGDLLSASCRRNSCAILFFYVWPCLFFLLGFLDFTISDVVTDIHEISAQMGSGFHLVASPGTNRSQFVTFVQNTPSIHLLQTWEREDTFEDYYKKVDDGDTWPAVVIERWEPPKYKIRLPYDFRSASTNPTEDLSYEQVMFDKNHTEWYYSNFIPLQILVDDYFIGKQQSTTVLRAQRMRHPDYYYSAINSLLSNLEWCLFLGFFSYAAIISTLFVAESDKNRLKPFLEAIGVNKTTYFASWILYFAVSISPMTATIFFSFAFFSSTIAGIQLTIISMMFGPALMLWTILAFTIFPGPFAIGSIVLSWIAILIPLIFFDVTMSSATVQYVASLIPHVNFFCATKKALDGDIVIGHMILFVLSIVILFLLTIYFDLVIPREGKEIAHPCFCFLSSKEEFDFTNSGDDAPEIESIDESEQLTTGIHIENLHKYYECDVWSKLVFDGANRIHAVRNVSLDIYNDQVFVLLGHNGAGKSSFCNVLNGRNTATYGKVLINDLDIDSDRQTINLTQGICPQEDVLWDNLTLLQHLKIHSGLKSAPLADIDGILEEFNLRKQKHTKVKNLSGGEKRKLSVAIAFLANPRIVYLDEPTCSMDPVSQRKVWNLIEEKKKGRVIILTTHFMQEAEVLGDRIGILRDGALQICGSPMFLKSKCGVGYTLRIFGEANEELLRTLENASDFLKPVGKLEYMAEFYDSHHFPKFFQQLEDSHRGGFTLEVTSLEEAFSKVSKISLNPKEIDSDIFQSNEVSLLMQIWVMMKQKYYSKRKWTIILTPIFVVLYTAFVLHFIFDVTNDYEPLPISLNSYRNITIPIAGESRFTQFLPHSTIPILSESEQSFEEETFEFHDDYLMYGGYYQDSMIFYNTTSMHSLPAFVNAWNSFRFQSTWNTSSSILVANHPLPLRDRYVNLMQDSEAIMIILMLVMCIKATVVKFTVQLWRERVTSQFKGMLLRMGASHMAYWLASLTYYYTTYCTMLAALFFSASVFNLGDIFYQQPATLPILFIAGPALVLAWSYNSFYYKKVGDLTLALQLKNVAMYIGIAVLYGLQDSPLLYILYFLPDLAFFDGILKIVIAHINDEHPKQLPVIIFFLIFDAFFWFFLILKKEHCKQNPNIKSCCRCKLSKSGSLSVVEEMFKEDKDVVAMRREILNSSALQTEIRVANARKVYPGKSASKCCFIEVEKAKQPVVGVGNVSIRVREGQTVALLGPNGAGKTTMIKALVGKHALTSGTATVNQKNVGTEQEEIRKSLGYCDQGSSLCTCLTGLQHLKIAMGLRGISDPALIDIISSEFQLTNHLQKKVKHFSGGTKRKLESALSMIGLPSFLILDEPTTGVDTFARKSIYELIQKTKDDRTFLLTTHSMDEAEILADEICIMVNGRMRCIGTAAYLKQRFAQGYTSEIHPLKDKYEEVNGAILTRFPNAEIVKSDEVKLRFRFPESKAWELFQFLEEDLNDMIKDYLVGSTTLEQVFMALAKEQICEHDDDEYAGGITSVEIAEADDVLDQTSLGDIEGTPKSLKLV